MSEYINNDTRRKEIIKNVLKKLHEGAPLDALKAEFGKVASEVSSAEIAEIEQQLINEGTPVEEVQKLCDIHVAFFRESLDKGKSPESTPGHPILTFKAENQLLERLLDEIKKFLGQYRQTNQAVSLETTRLLLKRLQTFDCHYRRKEHLLFPYLEQYGFSGPSKVMWGIHDQIRGFLKDIIALLENPNPQAEKVETAFTTLDTSMREMVYKEEKILFPAALEHLKDTDWVAIRGQEDEIGFFGEKPVAAPQQAVKPVAMPIESLPTAQPVAPIAGASGEIPLDTGLLTPEQINLLLCNLPVDVTFVDENDTVRFFSQTRERIFQRAPAIIGRKVQNCHPPQSVGKVQKILDDFRIGKRDVAEFWIQMGGKFVHIRYFALRDGDGKYRGTIEVSQDIAPLRALQGEKRLLDDVPAA